MLFLQRPGNKASKSLHVPVDTLSLIFLAQNNPPTIVRERILGLIQYWADAFRGKPQLAEVEELYEQLKGEGIEFPPIDLDALAPIATPQRVSVCVGGVGGGGCV